MPRKCKNHFDTFYYAWGKFTIKSQQRSITDNIKKIYKLYFGSRLGDQFNNWALYIICSTYYCGLQGCRTKTKSVMPFAIPMIWC